MYVSMKPSCTEMSSNDFSALPTKEHLTHSSYYQYLQIILDFGLQSLDIPLIFQLQGMCNSPVPFKEKMAKMVNRGQLRTYYHLETSYLNVAFYRMHSLFPCTKALVDLKGSRNDPKGMECLLSGEQQSTPGSPVWKRDD